MHVHAHKLHPRAVHACGALRLVGGCTRRHNNVGGVTAGQVPHNSSNVGGVTAGQARHNSCVDSVRSTGKILVTVIL